MFLYPSRIALGEIQVVGRVNKSKNRSIRAEAKKGR